MSRSIPALANPEVLRWARQASGFPSVAAARKIGVPDDRVDEWEAGTAGPSIAQLRNAARVYKRSLAVFFLSAPPDGFDTLRDFRRLQGSESGEWSPALHAEFARAHFQRDNAIEIAELDEIDPPGEWSIERVQANDSALASVARDVILAESHLELPGQVPDKYAHLNTWISGLEESGILVLATQGGRVEMSEMRAFSLYFEVLPVIVVNGSDSPRGRLFSVVHEYAHLLLHTEGLCDLVSDHRAVDENQQLEARCNAIAAEMLMPSDLIQANGVVSAHPHGTAWEYESLREAANQFGVSAEALLRRLSTLGLVTVAEYDQARQVFIDAYASEINRVKEQRQSGGNPHRNKVRDFGKSYVRLVVDAHERRLIDSMRAADFLETKVEYISKLAAEASIRGRE